MTNVSFTWSPSSDRTAKEESLFDPDTKDSGFQEEEPAKSPATMSPTNETNTTLSYVDEYAQFKCLVETPKLKAHSKRRLCFLASPEADQPSGGAKGQKKRQPCCGSVDSPASLLSDFSDRLAVASDDSDEERPRVGSDRIFQSEDRLFCHVKGAAASKEVNVVENENENEKQQQEHVKEAVEKSQDRNLIGDFSKSYALPLIDGSHPDLKCISASTLRDVLDGKFSEVLDSATVIDSRYPYEYRGGHVRGALNIYTLSGCDALLRRPSRPSNERHVLIFHCEFSKERGPKLMRHLRKTDRSINSRDYPALTFPELYLLEGGYKKFYEQFPDHCEPKDYRQMLHPEHAEEMRLFRRKCKSEDALRPVHSTKSIKRMHSEPVRNLSSTFFEVQI